MSQPKKSIPEVDPTVEIVNLPLERMRPHELNPNVMGANQFASLLETIREHGPDQPIVAVPFAKLGWDPEGNIDHVIVKGAHRYLVAERLALPTFPVIVKQWDEKTMLTQMVRDNEVTGAPDKTKMTKLINHLSPTMTRDTMAKAMGFDTTQKMLRKAMPATLTPDAAAALIKPTKIPRPKEVAWILLAIPLDKWPALEPTVRQLEDVAEMSTSVLRTKQ